MDNSAASTNPASNPNLWSGGNNPYVCDNITDKVFLLSTKEATTSEYGFIETNGSDSARIRVTTDYAKATGANQNSTAGSGGFWWLLSPNYDYEGYARGINGLGDAYDYGIVNYTNGGVVPALCIPVSHLP